MKSLKTNLKDFIRINLPLIKAIEERGENLQVRAEAKGMREMLEDIEERFLS